MSNIPWFSYLSVLGSLLTSSLGGLLCGLLAGLTGSLVSRFTSQPSRHLEVLATTACVVLAHTLSAKLGWSAILALISAGLTIRRYCFPNMEETSRVALASGARCLALLSELIIFVLLGNSITKRETWHWQFMLTATLLCYFSRALSVLLLSWVLNRFRQQRISYQHQLVMFLGGLRGAVAYTIIISYQGDYSDVFTDTALLIIFITVILNGVVAGPLVRSLHLTGRETLATPSNHWASYTWWEVRFLLPVLQGKTSLRHRETRSAEFKTNKSGLGEDNLAFDMQEKEENNSVDSNKHFNFVVNL